MLGHRALRICARRRRLLTVQVTSACTSSRSRAVRYRLPDKVHSIIAVLLPRFRCQSGRTADSPVSRPLSRTWRHWGRRTMCQGRGRSTGRANRYCSAAASLRRRVPRHRPHIVVFRIEVVSHLLRIALMLLLLAIHFEGYIARCTFQPDKIRGQILVFWM